jgi:protocatechuate 3,4-dioxygenase beta subunit
MVETDDRGRYTMWVEPGGSSVSGVADGYAPSAASGAAPGTIDLLLTPESSLAGKVVDAKTGAPVPGVHVSLEAADWGLSPADSITGDDGSFHITRIPPSRYTVIAKTDHGYGRSAGSTLVGLGQHVDGIAIKLWPALRVSGRIVIAQTHQACPHGSVRLVEPKTHADGQSHADGDGVVIDGVRPGTYTADVECAGYAHREPYDPIEVTQDVAGLEWQVDVGATIHGRVVTRGGAPVADAQLDAMLVQHAARSSGAWGSDRSTPKGEYRLTGLRGGTYRIELTSDAGLSPKNGYTVDVAAGSDVAKDLVIDDAGTIAGEVVGADGKPVANVAIDARASDTRYMFGAAPAKTKADGTFELRGKRPGDYRVTAQVTWADQLRKPGTNDDAEQGERVSVRAGEVAHVHLVVEAPTGTIKGTVVDGNGAPVTDAFVSSARESDAAGAANGGAADTRWTWDERPVLTGPDGTFEVSQLAPGKYTLRAYRKGGGEATAEHVDVGTSAQLKIQPTASIDGTVTTASSAPDTFSVEVADPKTGLRRGETFYRTGGHYTIADLPGGALSVTVQAPGAQKRIAVTLADGEHKTGLDVVLDATATLTGHLVDSATHAPVAGIMVNATTLGASDSISFSSEQRDNISDDHGQFTAADVPVGRVRIVGFGGMSGVGSDYGMFSLVREVQATASGTFDVGDLPVRKRRVKDGDPVGKLGIHFAQPAPDTAPDDAKLTVSWIDPAGPAANVGLEVGDVVTAVDGEDVTGANEWNSHGLLAAPPGTSIALTLARGPTVNVVLGPP